MELVFNQIDKNWVAEFEATSDFNLHLERESMGWLTVGQRTTSSGGYDESFKLPYDGRVIDYDFGALVYPKWIKVTSSSKVVKGEVTFA